MTWVRLDDALYDHPKWLGRTRAARVLWINAASWAAARSINGEIPDAQRLDWLGQLAGLDTPATRAAAIELVRSRLWARRGAGWQFVDLVEFPADSWLYQLVDIGGHTIYVGQTTHRDSRIRRHLATQPWADEIAAVVWTQVPPATRDLDEIALIRRLRPRHNSMHNGGPM